MAKTTSNTQTAEARAAAEKGQGVGKQQFKPAGPIRGAGRGKKETAPYPRRHSNRIRAISVENIAAANMDGDNSEQQQPHEPVVDAAKAAENPPLVPSPAPADGYSILLATMNSHFDSLIGNQNITNNSLDALTSTVSDMSKRVKANADRISTMQQEIKSCRTNQLPPQQ